MQRAFCRCLVVVASVPGPVAASLPIELLSRESGADKKLTYAERTPLNRSTDRRRESILKTRRKGEEALGIRGRERGREGGGLKGAEEKATTNCGGFGVG